MATKVHMEALSPTMEEGQVVRWLKSEGDEVAEGDVLAEIETDKATMELVARGSGQLRKRMLEEGQTAEVGSVIAVIAAEDEDISELVGGDAGAEAKAPEAGEGDEAGGGEEADEEADARGEAAVGEEAEAGEEVEGEARKKREVEAEDEEPAETGKVAKTAKAGKAAEAADEDRERSDDGGDGRVKASPLARRLASESGLSLRQVQGSGPGGRITKADIEAALEKGVAEEAVSEAPRRDAPAGREAAAPRFAQPVYDGPEVEEVPVTQMRKTIAKRLVTSIGPVPTFYLTVDLDMTRLVEARERMNELLEPQGLKVSVNDLLIKATAMALKRHPEVNAAWHDDHVKRHHRVHIGVAVAIDEGLITPVIRDADLKGAAQIGVEVRELAGRAREKKLKPDEYTGATFSISNLGMFGIEEFTAIINPPEAAILAVGAVEERVIVEDGEAMIAPRMKMTMSCDHRVVDGAMGAVFLQTLRGMLEEPGMAMV
jgi:pyruvate dehydrogenase E2 component (dihydrolipoamide acetyltransferase)